MNYEHPTIRLVLSRGVLSLVTYLPIILGVETYNYYNIKERNSKVEISQTLWYFQIKHYL